MLVKHNEHLAINRGFGTKEFGELLEKALAKEPKFMKKDSFAPSSLAYAGLCPRYWYYAFNGAEFEFDSDAASVSSMSAGSDSGIRIANIFARAGILVGTEIPARHDDPPIFGYIDALVEWKGEVIPVEIKTTKAEHWNIRAAQSIVPGYQLTQLLIYMYIKKYPRGFLLTENKNTNEIFIYPVKMTDEYVSYIEKVFDWMRVVKNNILLPTRPFTQASFACKGCRVKTTCWSGYRRGSVNGTDPNPGEITIAPLEILK